MRTKWALLTALLCYAAAPAATCDPRDQLSPLNEPNWTLAEPGSTTSRARVGPNPMTQQSAQMTDATVVLTRVPKLPSTSTRQSRSLDSRGSVLHASALGLPMDLPDGRMGRGDGCLLPDDA